MSHPSILPSLQRIMFVDDNPYDNEFHSIVLRKAGFQGEVAVCESGDEALAYFKSGSPPEVDLMFLDINLGSSSGFDLARQLLSDATPTPKLVIVLSSSPDPRDVTTAKSIPLIGELVTKPLTVSAIQSVVERHAGRLTAPK